ncbi:hypothetical protein IGB42_03325 [Andreprevotia sp. IGB-42]|uniref:PulJ/GspJ family protein n=1 Tax=Andreprevotia sp. IGB-42 TaxID=2497473 RepID=UPI00135879E8|nr:prepilin-type N-terminal cleavage/methylation domain-containing protein [Andreprevotia sp. IGB-42]KAF0812335.1 hypothetical protein IGB42_03325 [Andreprevotia sp. IGB-42]
MPASSKAAQHGFTLIEVMVALVMTALVMTLLMGASFYVLQIREKLSAEVNDGERGTRQRLWFRQTIAGLQAVKTESPDHFDGDETGFRALVLRPLSAELTSAPELIELRLKKRDEGGTALIYTAGETSVELASWPEGKARFGYFNTEGKVLSIWNSRTQASEHVPSAVEISVQNENDTVAMDYWLASVTVDPWIDDKKPPQFLLDAIKQDNALNAQ